MLFLDILLDFLIFMFGSCFGSFLTMLSYRMFHDDADFVFKRSFCPKCYNQLKNISLVPIFSWLFQGGKCTFCKEKISIRYPLIEIVNAIIFLLVFKLNNSTIDLNTIYFWFLGTFLLLMCIVDLEHLCIPNVFQYIFFVFGVVYIFYNYNGFSLFDHLFFGLIYYFMMKFLSKFTSSITKKDSIGDGDVPIIAICGSILGLQNIHIFLFLCGIFGIMFSFVYQIFLKKDRFPFIPSIVLSFVLTFYLSIFYFQP